MSEPGNVVQHEAKKPRLTKKRLEVALLEASVNAYAEGHEDGWKAAQKKMTMRQRVGEFGAGAVIGSCSVAAIVHWFF